MFRVQTSSGGFLRDAKSEIGLTMWIDKPRPVPGDLVTIKAEADNDCYLTVISVDSAGVATVLFPSDFKPITWFPRARPSISQPPMRRFSFATRPKAAKRSSGAVRRARRRLSASSTISSGSASRFSATGRILSKIRSSPIGSCGPIPKRPSGPVSREPARCDAGGIAVNASIRYGLMWRARSPCATDARSSCSGGARGFERSRPDRSADDLCKLGHGVSREVRNSVKHASSQLHAAGLWLRAQVAEMIAWRVHSHSPLARIR